MKRFVILAVALVATFAVSMKVYSYYVPNPNYYCAYFEEHGRCYASIGTACYGTDADCNWLD